MGLSLVLALLATRANEAPLSAASWTRVSSRTGGSAGEADLPVPAGADSSPVVDVDAAGDDDPTHPHVNVDGVDPTVSDPWRLLEPTAGTAAGAVPAEGSNAVPQGRYTSEGESASNRLGVSRQIKFGGTSIYEFDAESPIGEHVESSPTPLAIPGPADSGLGGGPVLADHQTTNMADSRLTPSEGGRASGAEHHAALPGFSPHARGTSKPPVGGSYAGSAAATPQRPVPKGAGVGVSLGDGVGLLCPPGNAAGGAHQGVTPSGARVNPGTRGSQVRGDAPHRTRGATPLCGSSAASRTGNATWRTPRPHVRPCPPSRIAACRSCSGSVQS